MIIESVFPKIVAEIRPLRERLIARGKELSLSDAELKDIISIVPDTLINSDAFLDRLTGLWRYEYGIPYNIEQEIVWGTHMWVPVNYLFSALSCAYARLSKDKLYKYMVRLTELGKHQETLVEMIPGCKLNSTVDALFEVTGEGEGNFTLDWVVGPHCGRTVLLDVKRRFADFIEQAGKLGNGNVAPEPNHDSALLFRSIEKKFLVADPNQQLQGAWIVTDIKQNETQLSDAFVALDERKVHFAILGDWKSDAYVLVRREGDEQYLRDLFGIVKSTRFTFM